MVFKLRYIERTGDHAEAASHALFVAPDHGPLLGFIHRFGQAGRSTGWRIAVHTLVLDIDLPQFLMLIGIDHHTPVLIGLPDGPGHGIVIRIRLRKTVGQCTGHFTTLAPYTSG